MSVWSKWPLCDEKPQHLDNFSTIFHALKVSFKNPCGNYQLDKSLSFNSSFPKSPSPLFQQKSLLLLCTINHWTVSVEWDRAQKEIITELQKHGRSWIGRDPQKSSQPASPDEISLAIHCPAPGALVLCESSHSHMKIFESGHVSILPGFQCVVTAFTRRL